MVALMGVHPEGEAEERFRFECARGRDCGHRRAGPADAVWWSGGVEPIFGEARGDWGSGAGLSARTDQSERHAGGGCFAGLRLQLNRGDIDFAQEKIMAWHGTPVVGRPRCLSKLSSPPTCAAPSPGCPLPGTIFSGKWGFKADLKQGPFASGFFYAFTLDCCLTAPSPTAGVVRRGSRNPVLRERSRPIRRLPTRWVGLRYRSTR